MTKASSSPNLSLVIIALNEAENLPRLLATVPAGVEILVLDSHSTDQTVTIAERFGAKVHQRSFDNYAAQKNAAAELASREWILSLDADEVPSEALWQEILTVVKNNEKHTAWRVRRRLVFLGRPMYYGKTADAPIRLWLRGTGSFQGAIHEEVTFTKAVTLRTTEAAMTHWSYASIKDYFERFNRYTSRIAQNHFARGTKAPSRAVMALRVPVEFVGRYILRLGFLDGYPGFVYALFGSVYAFVKYAKLVELEAAKDKP